MIRYLSKCNLIDYRLDRFLNSNRLYGRQLNKERKLRKNCRRFSVIRQHLVWRSWKVRYKKLIRKLEPNRLESKIYKSRLILLKEVLLV
jgi:hypothetical protein